MEPAPPDDCDSRCPSCGLTNLDPAAIEASTRRRTFACRDCLAVLRVFYVPVSVEVVTVEEVMSDE